MEKALQSSCYYVARIEDLPDWYEECDGHLGVYASEYGNQECTSSSVKIATPVFDKAFLPFVPFTIYHSEMRRTLAMYHDRNYTKRKLSNKQLIQQITQTDSPAESEFAKYEKQYITRALGAMVSDMARPHILLVPKRHMFWSNAHFDELTTLFAKNGRLRFLDELLVFC